MSRIVHFCQDVRGALCNWDRRMMKRLASSIIVNGKPLRTADDVRNWLLDELAQGHEVLPLSDDCDGFDYKKGCPGHEVPDEPEADSSRTVAPRQVGK